MRDKKRKDAPQKKWSGQHSCSAEHLCGFPKTGGSGLKRLVYNGKWRAMIGSEEIGKHY